MHTIRRLMGEVEAQANQIKVLSKELSERDTTIEKIKNEGNDYYKLLNRVDFHLERWIVPMLSIFKDKSVMKTMIAISSDVHKKFREHGREYIVDKPTEKICGEDSAECGA